MKSICIGLFGLIGVFSRYGLGTLLNRFFWAQFPWSTLVINLTGSFLIGIVYALGVERTVIPYDLRIAMIAGFLGGFTTFSSYCLETFQLIEKSKFLPAFAYLSLSPLFGVALTFFGVWFGRRLG